MNAQKLKWIALGAFVALAGLVWGVLQYMSSKAEEQLLNTLSEYNLQHRVHWRNASASFGGSVTLTDVRFDVDPRNESNFQADRVKISDLTDTRERQRLTLEIEGLSKFIGAREDEPVFSVLMGLPSGKADLPPPNISIALDARYDKDEAQATLEVRQKDGMDVDVTMQLGRIGALRELIRVAANMGNDLDDLNAMMNSPLGSFNARNPRAGRTAAQPDWTSLTSLHIKAFEVKLRERGMVKRSVALQKRYNIPLDPNGGSIKSQQNKAFEQEMKDEEASCRRDKNHPLFRGVKNLEQTCRAIMRFMSNDKDTLRVSIKPRTSVPFVQIPLVAQFLDEFVPGFSGLSRRVQPVSAQVLNLEVDS